MNTKMGLMTKKEKQSPLDEKPTTSRPWPDLPPKLLHIVAKNSTLMNNISYGGYVTKSYRVTTRRCNPTGKSTFPQLVAKGIDKDRCDADTCSIPSRPEYIWSHGGRRRPKPGRLVHIVGCSHGLLVGRGRGYLPSSQCYLWDPVLVWRSYCNMPPWNTSIPFKHVAISSSLTYPNNPIVMVLTGINHPAFVFYFYLRRQCAYRWINQDGWINQNCTLVDPYSSNQQLIQFTHAIGFKGKFYALSLQGTFAVIEESDSHLRITGLSTNRAVPGVPSKQFKEYLIESNGEILLLFLISRNSIHSVDNVEVYRLRFDRLSWVKMESLGDRTLFVGTNCCMSVNARKVGYFRGNCIYFIHQVVDGWWIYDMDRVCISPGWNVTDSTTKFPVWDEPEEEEQLICKKR